MPKFLRIFLSRPLVFSVYRHCHMEPICFDSGILRCRRPRTILWRTVRATAADWMSAASFLSMAGIIAFEGADGARYLMGWTGGYVLLALLLLPHTSGKFAKFTVPDFVGDRYYSSTARLVAVVCVIFISFTYVAGQMRGVGVVFSRFLEVDINSGVVIGMAIVFFYAVLGGMKGITYTQVAQYCVLIFAYMVPAIYISIALTNNPFPMFGLGSEMIEGGYSAGEAGWTECRAGHDGIYVRDQINHRYVLYYRCPNGRNCGSAPCDRAVFSQCRALKMREFLQVTP